MNKDLQDFARKKLKKDLLKCNKNEQTLFKRMYGNPKSSSIDRVVDDMPDDKLDWAMEQVRRTLNKKKSQIKFSSAWFDKKKWKKDFV